MTFIIPKRSIARTNIQITPVAMGCWPIAGITSIDVTTDRSLATLQAAYGAGINFFDTAYCYGYEGESEKMIAEALSPYRDQIAIATKGGIHWGNDRKQRKDAHPATIKRQCEESLRRLQTDRIDLYYLHAPDPRVPLAESAGAFQELLDEGKILSVGVSNCSLEQLEEFSRVVLPHAYQPHYNMLQREIEESQLPWCIEHDVSVMVYWPLMKGLLAGKLSRDHQFEPRDGRQKYPMFQGAEWHKNHDFLDELRTIANDCGRNIAQLVIRWTIQRTGITAALCGAKRPEQISDNAAAMEWELTTEQLDRIDAAIERRGPIVSQAAV
ncbi:MAG TPA: aldo/keto reductase [Planctomycetaceae bacterium]|nr:aldo/keto reductase [Planctomycetaceae bacterium]